METPVLELPPTAADALRQVESLLDQQINFSLHVATFPTGGKAIVFWQSRDTEGGHPDRGALGAFTNDDLSVFRRAADDLTSQHDHPPLVVWSTEVTSTWGPLAR